MNSKLPFSEYKFHVCQSLRVSIDKFLDLIDHNADPLVIRFWRGKVETLTNILEKIDADEKISEDKFFVA